MIAYTINCSISKISTKTWEQRKLGEVLSLLKDGTHGTHQDAEEGPYLLSAKNIKNGQIIIDDSSDRKISEDEFNQIHTKFTLENGDILLTIVGSIGESAILENAGKFTFQRSVAFLRPSEEMTSRFLKTEIESVQFQKELNDRKSQSAQPGVYLGDLSKIPIYITSKEEQKKIGEYFSNLDNFITLHQRKYDKLLNIKKSMLEKMFPKNGNDVPEIRFKGFTDAWEQRKLGDIADIVGGGTPSTENPGYWDGEIDWYAPAEIADQIYVNSSQKKITDLGYDNSSAKMLPPGTVLFTSRAGIGKTAILTRKGCTNQGFQSIVPHRGELDSYFIFSRTEELKRYGELVGAGSTFVEVSGKQMTAMELMMPPSMREQQTIGGFFQHLDNLITLHQRKLEKLKNIKKSMLEKMFV